MTKFRLAILSSLLLIGACQCDPGPGPVAVGPEIETEGAPALSLEGCPVVDANGTPVEGATPTSGTITLTNVGRATATLAVTFEGEGADQFTLGEFDPILDADNSVDIPVTFAPRSAAAVNVTMKVDDGDPATDPLSISLAGLGLNFPPNPTLKVSVENDPPGSGEFTPCEEGFTCSVEFPGTFFGQAVSKRVRIENTGCPALRVTGLDVAKGAGGGNDLAFEIEQPATLPTVMSPILLNVADGTQTLDVQMRFAPVDDDAQSEQRRGIFSIVTNDPSRPVEGEQLSLRGSGLRPAFVASPSFCNYTRETDDCGNNPRVPGKATITLSNTGNVPVTIDSADFAKGGNGGRFALGSDPTGQTLEATIGTLTFDVNYTDNALFVQDELVLTASAQGMPAGVVTVSLSGGTPPRITVEPEPVAFDDGGTGTRVVNIVAGSDGGTLTVDNVFIDEINAGTPNPFFRVTMAPAAGTQIQPGNSAPVTLEYTRPPSGGSQEATMRIASNDPGYPAPDHRQVRVYSQTPADLPPTAVILGGVDNEEEAVLLTQAELIGMMNRVPINGSDSFDFTDDGTQVPVTSYQFSLVQNPDSLGTLVDVNGNSVSAVKQSEGEIFLDFSSTPSVGKRYLIKLYVFDAAGQRSADKSLYVIING